SSRDLAPRRALPDAAIIDAALALPSSVAELVDLPVFRGRAQRREAQRWFAAIVRARELPDDALPPLTARYDGPPPARSWATRDSVAAARLAAARTAAGEIADHHALPVENLLAPETLRRVTWSPPEPVTADTVAAALRRHGAREWQVRLTSEAVARAFVYGRAGSQGA